MSLNITPDGARYIVEPRNLTYDAGRHNWDEVLRIRLVPPLGGASYLELRASGIAGRADEAWRARMLNASGGLRWEPPVTGFRRLAPRAEVGPVWLPLIAASRINPP